MDHNELWETLKEMGIPDHLTCLLRNLYADQEATVRTRHGSKLGKEYVKAVYCPPCLFNLYAEYIMRNAGLKEEQVNDRLLLLLLLSSFSRVQLCATPQMAE